MRTSGSCWYVATVVALLLIAGSAAAQGVENLAALGAGGHLVFFSSQYNDAEWKAEHLIDGSPQQGWAGQNSGPQAVIIAFKNNGLAEIQDILINPYTKEDPSTWAKEVEVQVSTTYPFRDFRSVGKFTLKKEGNYQTLSLPQPTPAPGPLREGPVPQQLRRRVHGGRRDPGDGEAPAPGGGRSGLHECGHRRRRRPDREVHQ